MSADQTRWTAEETANLRRLRAAGKSWAEIGKELTRTPAAAKNRFALSTCTREWTEARKKYLRDKRAEEKTGPMLRFASDGERASPELLADRDRRRTRLIDVRYDLLGDPEPGRSALDRMVSA